LHEDLPEYPGETNGNANLLSFIIHLWQEDAASNEHQATWRGYITQVPNGKRIYFKNINEISSLIIAQLMTQK
jgi:hypothetical protein